MKRPVGLFTEQRTIHVALTLQKQKIDDFIGHELLFEVDIAAHHRFGEGQFLQFTEFGEDLLGQRPIESFTASDSQRLNVGPNLIDLHPLALFGSHVAAGNVQESVAALGLEQPRHGAETDVGFQLLQSRQEVVLVVPLRRGVAHQRRPFQHFQRFQLGARRQFQRVDVVDALVTQLHQIVAESVENHLTVVARHVVE